MAEHTSGNWWILDNGSEVELAVVARRTEPFRDIAYLKVEDGQDFAEVEANARLIAAAPELLAAVQSAAWLMQRVAEWDGTGEPITKFAAQVHGAEFRSALAKARGEG